MLFKVTFSLAPLFLFAFRGRKNSQKEKIPAPPARRAFEKAPQNFSGMGTVRT
jgi:hypothetical protein